MTDTLPPEMISDTGELIVTDATPAMTGARWFVTAVFTVIGLSFVAATALLIWEFRETDWLSILWLHSHLFVFFPVLGLVALAAFHLPATVFTHMYWTHIPNGRLRFCFGTLVALGLTVVFNYSLNTSNAREVWQIAPRVLAGDRAEPAGCNPRLQTCSRLAVSDSVSALRQAARARFGVSKFARVCTPDPMLEDPDDVRRERFCFASGSKLSGPACCKAQELMSARIVALSAPQANRSLSDSFNNIAQPLKVFFVIVVVVIGVFLVIWRKLLEAKYAEIAAAIERALLIGAAAMLPWPFMDYAFLQGMQTLTGRESPDMDLRFSLVIAPWALLLLVFFLARMGRKIERLGQLAGAVASLVALLRYEVLSDAGVRMLGVGAPNWMIVLLLAFATICLMSLRWPHHLQRAINGAIGRNPDIGPSPPLGSGGAKKA